MLIKRGTIPDLAIEFEIEKKIRSYISIENDFFEYYTNLLTVREVLNARHIYSENEMEQIHRQEIYVGEADLL